MKKKLGLIILTAVGVAALGMLAGGASASLSAAAEDITAMTNPNNNLSLSGDWMPAEALDQFQQSAGYGYIFDSTLQHWQEFIPTLENISNVDLYLEKIGNPGNVVVELRDETGAVVIDTDEIHVSEIPILGWVTADFFESPMHELTPGQTYRIYVSSTAPINPGFDYYAWRGSLTSTYCPRCDTSVEASKPDYHFAFRTDGFGVERITRADFDGNRGTDLSVYRPSNGKWYIKGQSPVSWGLPGDLPVPGEYLDLYKNDIAVYRPSNGKWYIKGQGPISWGFPGDIPVPADYDGDDITDIAVLRPSNGRWYIRGMGNFNWYLSGDIPVPCDYDGDFDDDIAVFRPSNNKWYIKGSSPVSWAQTGDIPVPGDYDGDGTCDIAVYRPSNGNWYVRGQGKTSWGFTGDIPVPGDYDACGDTEIAVLRPSNGKWYIQGMGNFFWYYTGDYPLPVRDTDADGEPYQ